MQELKEDVGLNELLKDVCRFSSKQSTKTTKREARKKRVKCPRCLARVQWCLRHLVKVHKLSRTESVVLLQGCSWYRDRGGKTRMVHKQCPADGCSTVVRRLSDPLRRVHSTTLTKLKLQLKDCKPVAVNENISENGEDELPTPVHIQELVTNFHLHMGSIDGGCHVDPHVYSTSVRNLIPSLIGENDLTEDKLKNRLIDPNLHKQTPQLKVNTLRNKLTHLEHFARFLINNHNKLPLGSEVRGNLQALPVWGKFLVRPCQKADISRE